jgi:DNA-binding transcriptional regulator YhcF (GntR family)
VPDIDSDYPDAPPMYVIITKYLACKTADGQYKNGELLPRRMQIAEEFGVHPTTAERGLRLLMYLGYAWPTTSGAYTAHMPEEPVLSHGGLPPDARHILDTIIAYLQAIESKIDLLLAHLEIPTPSPPTN